MFVNFSAYHTMYVVASKRTPPGTSKQAPRRMRPAEEFDECFKKQNHFIRVPYRNGNPEWRARRPAKKSFLHCSEWKPR